MNIPPVGAHLEIVGADSNWVVVFNAGKILDARPKTPSAQVIYSLPKCSQAGHTWIVEHTERRNPMLYPAALNVRCNLRHGLPVQQHVYVVEQNNHFLGYMFATADDEMACIRRSLEKPAARERITVDAAIAALMASTNAWSSTPSGTGGSPVGRCIISDYLYYSDANMTAQLAELAAEGEPNAVFTSDQREINTILATLVAMITSPALAQAAAPVVGETGEAEEAVG